MHFIEKVNEYLKLTNFYEEKIFFLNIFNSLISFIFQFLQSVDNIN